MALKPISVFSFLTHLHCHYPILSHHQFAQAMAKFFLTCLSDFALDPLQFIFNKVTDNPFKTWIESSVIFKNKMQISEPKM